MARLFDDAASEYLEVATPVIVAAPLAFACWFNTNDVDGDPQIIMSITDTGGGIEEFVMYLGGSGAKTIRYFAYDGTFGQAEASTTFSVNVWHHAAGAEYAVNNRAVYHNGAGKGTNATSVTPVNMDVTTIGTYVESGVRASYMSGLIAEVAIWDLTAWGANDAERAVAWEKAIISLAKGYSPLFYPLGLVSYWPLVRGLNDKVGGSNLTANGTVVSAHPRVIYPSKIWVPHIVVGAPPTANPKGPLSHPLCGAFAGPISF